MAGIGFSEMLIIAGIALVLLGPEKFPEFAKMAIRAWRDLQKYIDEMKTEIAKEVKPLEKEIKEITRKAEEVYREAIEEMETEDSNYTSYTNKGYSSQQYLEHSVTTYPDSDTGSSGETSEDESKTSESTFEPYDPDVPQADLGKTLRSYAHTDEEIYPELQEGTAEEESKVDSNKSATNEGKENSSEEEIEYPERLDG